MVMQIFCKIIVRLANKKNMKQSHALEFRHPVHPNQQPIRENPPFYVALCSPL